MYQHISPYELTDNPFRLIAKEWMLITAKKPDDGTINTMTASWGGCGILWKKPVAFVFIRPQRYTLEFVHANPILTLSFFGETTYRDALQLCGTVSGRGRDKIREAGLHPVTLEDPNAVTYEEARMTFVCRKLYEDAFREDAFLDPEPMLSNYAAKDYHSMFICEITDVLVKS